MRIVARLRGGPRDGERVSVGSEQQEVASERRDGEGEPVGRYVKDEGSLRDASPARGEPGEEGYEPGDADGFDGHGIEQACDFNYQEA